MVDLESKSEQTVAARETIRGLYDQGLSEGELLQLVRTEATVLNDRFARNGAHVNDRVDVDPGQNETSLPMFDELPEGLIDLPAAASKYARSRHTLHAWVRQGRLPVVARLKGPARGGGFLLVSESAVVALLEDPPRRGRPPD